jgi:hypothetical protein
MAKILQFYLDDSGTRRPDHDPGKRAAHGKDWFALGGVLLNEEDESGARAFHKAFCAKWDITYPLHSVEIRGRTGKFLWLTKLSETERQEFYEGLYQIMRLSPLVGLACVIDRPGYNHRYWDRYGRRSWHLCKTAFAVVVERAAKEAIRRGRKLRVLPEACNKPEDALVKSYYEGLKSGGMPFAAETSGKYGPLSAEEFRGTLYELRPKNKSSPMAQFADLYLWPMCMGGYHASNLPYSRLMSDGKLIECTLRPEERGALGTKYSCFDLVQRRA